MNLWTTTFFALALGGAAGPAAPPEPAALRASFDSFDELKTDIDAANKVGMLKDEQALEFAERAVALAEDAKDAGERGAALKATYSLRYRDTEKKLDKPRSQIWDLLVEKDADNGAALAPLVSTYLSDEAVATALAKKSKAPEVKAACAYVPLKSLINAEERSEADSKKLAAGLRALKKDFGTVTDPARKRAWSEICDDLLFQVEKLSVGADVPDIEAADTAGVKFKLSDYRGKVVMLDFWGHW